MESKEVTGFLLCARQSPEQVEKFFFFFSPKFCLRPDTSSELLVEHFVVIVSLVSFVRMYVGMCMCSGTYV